MGNVASMKALIPLKPNGPQDVINPQLAKDLEAIMEARMELSAIEQKIKKLAAALKTMKDPLLGIQEIMGLVMNESGAKIKGLSAVDNLDSDLRSMLGTAQSAFNTAADPKNVKERTEMTKKMMDIINELQAFVKEQEGAGKNAVVGPADLKNIQGAIDSIKSPFGSNWGKPSKMGADILDWTSDNKKGAYTKQLRGVTNGFQTLNQSVSALSTTTNTKLSYEVEQFKQVMGMMESDNQLILKTQMTEVGNQRSQ